MSDSPTANAGSRASEEPRDFEIVRAALEPEYELLEELGRGGMGIVYRARERALQRDVAIKVLPFAMTFDPAVVERFEREARTSAQLEHPGIVPIYRVGRTGSVTYFVMRFVRGRPLSEELLVRGTLPVPEIRALLAETGAALAYAAARGVVHRDIKPDNIMVDEGGRFLLTDFGIARTASDSRLTATGLSVGTPRYMSPEQARARPVDARSDIYSLGVVAYECLTGQPPFDGDDPMATLLAHLQSPLPHPKLVTEEERGVFPLIERMLAKDPDRRPQSGAEVLSALGIAVAGQRRAPDRAPAASGSGIAPTADVVAIDAKRGPLHMLPPLLRELSSRAWSDGLAGIRRMRPLHYAIAGAVAVTLVGANVARDAAAHRSRCPSVVPAAGAAVNEAGAASRSVAPDFSLLVDPLPDLGVGSGLRVFYDVCGLARGATFMAELTVSPSGLDRVRNRGASARTQADGKASGPAVRRSHMLETASLPEGSYSLLVAVTDSQNRRRTLTVPLRITAKK